MRLLELEGKKEDMRAAPGKTPLFFREVHQVFMNEHFSICDVAEVRELRSSCARD